MLNYQLFAFLWVKNSFLKPFLDIWSLIYFTNFNYCTYIPKNVLVAVISDCPLYTNIQYLRDLSKEEYLSRDLFLLIRYKKVCIHIHTFIAIVTKITLIYSNIWHAFYIQYTSLHSRYLLFLYLQSWKIYLCLRKRFCLVNSFYLKWFT